MNWKKRVGPDGGQRPIRLLLLALFFLAGIFLGQVSAGQAPASAGEELERYLSDYLQVGGEASPRVALTAAVLYFRYPLAAFFLGFASIGVFLLPVLTVAFGFFLSFSVCCFTAAFGPDGVLLALAVFGLRCAVTLPCYFLVAVPAWEASLDLAILSFGKGGGRRAAPTAEGGNRWARLGGVAVALLAGLCAELALAPEFLRMVLERLAP